MAIMWLSTAALACSSRPAHVQGDALHAMELALALEKLNFSMLFDLCKTAEKHEDSNMSDFLESMLAEQVRWRPEGMLPSPSHFLAGSTPLCVSSACVRRHDGRGRQWVHCLG